MRARSTILAVSLVALSALTPASATAAVNPGCLNDPVLGLDIFGQDALPTLTTASKSVDVAVWGVKLADCPNTSVTAVTPGGGVINVPLNVNLPEKPPDLYERLGGHLTLPLGYGAGEWHLTKITSNGSSKTLHHPFEVHRGGTITLNAPAAVSAPNPVAVSGSVKHYTSTGSLVASPNTSVAIIGEGPGTPVIKNLTTNSAGNFSGTVARPPGSSDIYATRPPENFYYEVSPSEIFYTASTTRTAVVNQPVQPGPDWTTVQHSSTAYVNEWWRVDTTTTPAKVWNDLQVPTTAGWKTTGSFGYSASDGKVTRWWKPKSPGVYNLRLLFGTAPNGPYNTSFAITVKSKQTIPTYTDATVVPTSGGTVYRGTPMTAQGHLKVRYSNGTVGPFANQRLLIAGKPTSGSNWYLVMGSVVTNSNGYFITHFGMPSISHNVDIRFLYLSPYVTIKNSQAVKANTKVIW